MTVTPTAAKCCASNRIANGARRVCVEVAVDQRRVVAVRESRCERHDRLAEIARDAAT